MVDKKQARATEGIISSEYGTKLQAVYLLHSILLDFNYEIY